MIVYAVIEDYGYEGLSAPDAIFDSLEQAEKYQKAMGWQYRIFKYTLNDEEGFGESI